MSLGSVAVTFGAIGAIGALGGAGGDAYAATLGPVVTIEADDDASFPTSYDVADELVAGTVLRVGVIGFEPFARALIEQCTTGQHRTCGNPWPVQFDENGQTQFQYLITDDFVGGQPVRGGCRLAAPPCSIVVRTFDGNTRGEIQSVFVDAVPPPGRIDVTPSRGLSLEGERVTVTVSDYPPNATVTAMLCAAPDASGGRCGAPGPSAAVVVGSDGTGRAQLVLRPGPVGTRRLSCARGDDCGISVVADDVFTRAAVVPISWAAPPGADYDPTRLAFGLALAGLLIAIAFGLLLRTDWSAVGEAAAPEIDDAKYADLDAIIAALPPEEEELTSHR